MFEWFNLTLPVMNTVGMRDMARLPVVPTSTGVDIRTLFGNRTGDGPSGLPGASPSGLGVKDITTPSGTPNIDAGHFYSIKADGPGNLPSGGSWRVYLGFATSVRTVDETSPTGICWPLLDGETMRGRLAPGGTDRGTGLPSGLSVATGLNPYVLNFKCNVGSGFLRIYRSSIGEGQVMGDAFVAPNIRF